MYRFIEEGLLENEVHTSEVYGLMNFYVYPHLYNYYSDQSPAGYHMFPID